MAIISRGYQGEVGWSTWAEYAGRMGAKCSVLTAGAMKVTAKQTGTRLVTIAPGAAMAAGILDTNEAALDYGPLPEVLSGSRWFVIGTRHRWGSGLNVTEPFHIAGATGAAIPSSLPAIPMNPGSEFVQPLALVRIDQGKTVPQQVIDLRVWATNGGGAGTVDGASLIRQYITEVGSRLTFGDQDWQVQVDAAGNAAWALLNPPPGPRPYLSVRRPGAFSGLVAGGSIPFYAGAEDSHLKYGAWDQHFSYSNGAGTAANPIANTAPAYIQTRTPGLYAYGCYLDFTSAGNAANMAVSAAITGDTYAGGIGPDDPYWHQAVGAGERVHWTLTNTLWLPRGARFAPSFGKSSGSMQVNRWNMWMTRLGD